MGNNTQATATACIVKVFDDDMLKFPPFLIFSLTDLLLQCSGQIFQII